MKTRVNSVRTGFNESLAVNVIQAGRCFGCGACVVVCPFDCLEYRKETPLLVKNCEACGICLTACPMHNWSTPEMEKSIFGRERNAEEQFGIYRGLVIAQTTKEAIHKVAQDGGVVTSLLAHAIRKGIIDGAIVSGVDKEKPFLPTPKLVTSEKELLETAGTRYSYSPNLLAIVEAVRKKKQRVAFVGTPCQIRAVRKIQIAGLKKYAEPIKLVIGLMCSKCFAYEGLIEEHLHEALGINVGGVRKMNIKGKIIISTESGTQTTTLAEVEPYVRKECRSCNDFSSELADISAGGLGLNGWTFTIIRTQQGEDLFSSAEKAGAIRTRDVEEEPSALGLLRRLSRAKRVPR